MTVRRRHLIPAIALLWSSMALAQTAPADGTYMMDGGSYSIRVEQQGDTLTVYEPNKTSTYRRQPDGSFHFYNPNTDTVYGMRIVDATTIEAFRPFQDGNVPVRLNRVGAAPAPVATGPRTVAIPPSTASTDAGGESQAAIADAYLARAQSDRKNAQAWAFCSAAALKRSVATGEEADAYGRQAAAALRTIATDPAYSPCPDAIPARLWGDGVATDAPAPPPVAELSMAEEQRLRALNDAADTRAVNAVAVRDRALREQAERDAAARAAQAQFTRDREAYEAAAAKSAADRATYDRDMDIYRRVTAGAPQ